MVNVLFPKLPGTSTEGVVKLDFPKVSLLHFFVFVRKFTNNVLVLGTEEFHAEYVSSRRTVALEYEYRRQTPDSRWKQSGDCFIENVDLKLFLFVLYIYYLTIFFLICIGILVLQDVKIHIWI